MISTLLLYTLLSAAMFYLGSRALITEGIWRMYPTWLAKFMDCAACTGFWWGLIWATTIPPVDFVAGLSAPATPIIIGLCMVVLVPVAAALMQYGLEILGSVQGPPEE